MYSIVIPVLNEKENLKELLPRLFSPDCEIIICDNGSTDGSVRLVEDALPNFNVRLSRGTGTVVDAILRGIGLAVYDRIIVMDGDLSHSPEIVPLMAKALEEADMVIGSRYCRGGKSRDSFINRFISRGLNLLCIGLAPGIEDRVSGFWGIRKSLTEVDIRNTCKPMLEYLVRVNPRVVQEISYSFQPRTAGQSKLGRTSSIPKAAVDMLVLYLQKFNRFVKYCIIGGIGTLVCLGVTYFFTEVTGVWYMFSVVMGAFVAAIFNFFGHKFVTYAREGAHLERDYEWNAWYRGNPLQKYWKRKIGFITKEFLGNPSSLLDVGCGSSPVINLFHCTRVGLDLSQEKLDFIGRYSDALFLQCDLSGPGMPTFTESFEAVVCNNVLEHSEDPERVVEDISRRLVVGGTVVVTVPNMANPLTRVVEWIYGKLMPGGYAKEHICKFTPRSLDELCRKFGLKLLKRKAVFTDMVCLYEKGGDY